MQRRVVAFEFQGRHAPENASNIPRREKRARLIVLAFLCLYVACFLYGCIGVDTNEEELFASAKGGSCSPNEKLLVIQIKTDDYAFETSWTLVDTSNETTLLQGPPAPYKYADDTLYTGSTCLPPGRYEFTINDLQGDGLCCEFGRGYYRVLLDYQLVQEGECFEEQAIIVVDVAGSNRQSDDEAPVITQPANRNNLPMVDINVFIGQTFADAIGSSIQDFFNKATNHLRSLNYHPNWVIHSNTINDRGRGNRFSLSELKGSSDKPFSELLENFKNEAERLGVSSGPRAYLTSTHWKNLMGGNSFGCQAHGRYGVTAAGPNLQGQQLVNSANIFAHEVAHTLGLQGPLPEDILDELAEGDETVRESLERLGEKRRFYHPFWRHLPGNDAAARYWKQQARDCLSQPGNSYPADDEHTIGLWHMDEDGSGITALADASGFGNTLVRSDASEGVVGHPGRFGRAVGGWIHVLNTGTDRDAYFANTSLEGTSGLTELTFEFWLMLPASGVRNDPNPFGLGHDDDDGFRIDDGNSLEYHNESLEDGFISTDVLPLGIWNHIALTWSFDDVRIWLNGELAAEQRASSRPVITFLRLGGQRAFNTNFSSGYVDEARLSRVVRYSSTFVPPQAPFR
jgi:hypothetical protein